MTMIRSAAMLLVMLTGLISGTGCATTALHRAAKKGSFEGVEKALLRGISPNARDNEGDTPLHYAAGRGLKEALPALLAPQGGTLEQTEALFRLAESVDDLMIIDLLLRNGADLNASDNAGRTPLHMAALNNNPAGALMLLARGADAEAKDKLGRTPVELALQHGYRDFIEILKKGELEKIRTGRITLPALPGAAPEPTAPPSAAPKPVPATPVPAR